MELQREVPYLAVGGYRPLGFYKISGKNWGSWTYSSAMRLHGVILGCIERHHTCWPKLRLENSRRMRSDSGCGCVGARGAQAPALPVMWRNGEHTEQRPQLDRLGACPAATARCSG